MRDNYKPPNAEGYINPTEREKQTTRGGIQGNSTRRGESGGTMGGAKGSSVATQRRKAAALKKLGGGDSDSKNTTFS